jgi:hypothetical protein
MDEEQVDRVNADQLKTFLRLHDKPYSWLASQLGVANGTVNQWLRKNDRQAMPEWAEVSAARLIRQFEPTDGDLGLEEMEILAEWARQEGIGPIRLAVRILREEIAARKKRRKS